MRAAQEGQLRPRLQFAGLFNNVKNDYQLIKDKSILIKRTREKQEMAPPPLHRSVIGNYKLSPKSMPKNTRALNPFPGLNTEMLHAAVI